MTDRMNPPEKKSNRLSRLLGKRDKSPIPPTTDPLDSAYASSDAPSGEPQRDTTAESTPDMVPVEKNSELANIDKDRNLGVRPETGEVLDRDTGEVVTVVTTTTTTTTTTTRKPGQDAKVNKDVNEQVQETTQPALPPGTTPAALPASSTISEMPANPPILESKVPDRTTSRPLEDSPPIPSRSARRKSGEIGHHPTQASHYPSYNEDLPPPTGGFYGSGAADVGPVSPIGKHNYSYPSRSRDPRDNEGMASPAFSTADQPQHHNKSTMSDLRAAAKGIHGVGETLRGTLNSTIDKRFPNQNPEKAAAADYKNEQVLSRGRTEMEGIPSRGQHPAYERTATNEQVVPGSFSEEELPPPQPPIDEERERRDSQKARSIGKLFKRKPVAGKDGGELRARSGERKYF